MIRWRFVFTRLFIVAAILLLLAFGLEPVVSYVTVRGIEQSTGAKVEIGRTIVGLLPPSVEYRDVRIADPRDGKEMKNAVSADSIKLVIDGNAWMHRRWVARDGRITGLKIGSQRETSGHFNIENTTPEPSGPSMLDSLIGDTAEKLSSSAKNMVGELETVRRSKEIQDRWEQDYANLTERARQLESKIRQVRDRARGIDNPLRDWKELEHTLSEARAARDELISIRNRLDEIPNQLQADLVALDQAKQIDLEKVDQYVPGDLTGAGDLGVDLIAEGVRDRIAQIRSYLDGGKSLADYTIVAPETDRHYRGDWIDMDPTKRPKMLIRHCRISGTMRAGGNIYEMEGQADNMTPTPEWLAEPTRIRLDLTGPDTLQVEYVRDRRQGAHVDLMTLYWPEMEAHPMKLDGGESAKLAMRGGKREVWIQIRTQGDDIQGRLVSKQVGVNLDLIVVPKYADSPGIESLRKSLAAVQQIEIDANFSGTWKKFDLKLNTNLGQILRRAGEDAIADQMHASKEKLAVAVNKAHAEQTIKLRRLLGDQAEEARSLLASADKSIQEMSQKVFSEVNNAEELLGSRLRSAVMGKLR